MDWSKGFSSRFIARTVDPHTWGDTEEIEVTGGTISRDSTTDLVESASLTVTQPVGEQWIRVYLIAEQEGQKTCREALFTGLATTPERSINGRREENSLDCYSVLKVADDILLPLGYFIPSGSRSGEMLERLLSDIPGKLTIAPGSPYLTKTIVAGVSDSKLKMSKQIVDAIGWQIRIDGMGHVSVGPKPKAIVASFNSQDKDVIEPQVRDNFDSFSIPNVVRVTMGGSTATVRDDSEGSEYSTVKRGREIWKSESASTISDSESLGAYAMRRLKELQAPARTLTYSRRFDPGVVPGSLVSIVYPEQNISGTFRVQSQEITLGYGARTSEDAVYES